MKIYYRLSDCGYSKIKPSYINNENCLNNFLKHFRSDEIVLICDNVSDQTWNTYKNTKVSEVVRTNAGSSAAGFNLCLDLSLMRTDDDEIIYFIEGDYIHRLNSRDALIDAFTTGAQFATLYSHKDKWIPATQGGNPFIGEDGAEITKVYLGHKYAWMLTNSTTCSWAAKLKTLKETQTILRKHTTGTYPRDMEMFLELRSKGYGLVQPVPPSFATHGETKWLAPLLTNDSDEIAWGKIMLK